MLPEVAKFNNYRGLVKKSVAGAYIISPTLSTFFPLLFKKMSRVKGGVVLLPELVHNVKIDPFRYVGLGMAEASLDRLKADVRCHEHGGV